MLNFQTVRICIPFTCFFLFLVFSRLVHFSCLDNLVFMSQNGSLISIDRKTQKKRLLMSGGQLREVCLSNFSHQKLFQQKQNFTGIVSVSNDMTALLLRYSYIPVRVSILIYAYTLLFILNVTCTICIASFIFKSIVSRAHKYMLLFFRLDLPT